MPSRRAPSLDAGLRDALTSLDRRLVEVLRSGDIRLLNTIWLIAQPEGFRLPIRQELEALETQNGVSPFLSPEEAAALVERGERAAGVLSHGWLSPGDCDPRGARVNVVQHALCQHVQLEGLFWDQGSLYQRPRSTEQQAAFGRAIAVMGDLYASAIGTTVLQLKEIPPRPEEYDGALCLFGLAENVDASAVRAALGSHGEITSCELNQNPPLVRFATHEAALAVRRRAAAAVARFHAAATAVEQDSDAGVRKAMKEALGLACDGADTLYNERSYDGRDGGEGRVGDDGRGWCCFEDVVSTELLIRLYAFPRMREALSVLSPKLLALSSTSDALPVDVTEEPLEQRVERATARISKATFTGKGDKEVVPQLYKNYVGRIADALQQTLAVASAADALQELPPLPVVAAPFDGELPIEVFETLRAWHTQVLRVQHAHIRDALSGRLLNTLDDCVPIALTGTDAASGKPLGVRDASGLSAWLRGARDAPPCVLLTAGPAAGKTWLLSQLLMRSLDHAALVPILIKVELLQQMIRSDEAAFAAGGPTWIDTHLRLAHEPLHYRMLRQAMRSRRALLLIDGLDEAGALRERLEHHLVDVIAPQGNALLCTSRPAGLGDCFGSFSRLELSPLSDAQQEAFLVRRLGAARAAYLAPYVRERVPMDAETRQRVTANP